MLGAIARHVPLMRPLREEGEVVRPRTDGYETLMAPLSHRVVLLERHASRGPRARERLRAIAELALADCSLLGRFRGRIAHDALCLESSCLAAARLRGTVDEQEAAEGEPDARQD